LAGHCPHDPEGKGHGREDAGADRAEKALIFREAFEP
jgi:hypothetical protein